MIDFIFLISQLIIFIITNPLAFLLHLLLNHPFLIYDQHLINLIIILMSLFLIFYYPIIIVKKAIHYHILLICYIFLNIKLKVDILILFFHHLIILF